MQLPPLTPNRPKLASPTLALCPHGVAPGICPSCSGGGGGGGGKAKSPGLMSWNEAFSVWSAIQTAETRKKDYLKGVETSIFLKQNQANHGTPLANSQNGLFTRFTQSVLSFLQGLGIRTNPNAENPAGKHINQPTDLKTVAMPTLSEQIAALGRLAAQKLAALLNDSLKLVEEGLRNNLEVIKSLIAQMKWKEALGNALYSLGSIFQSGRVRSLLETLKEQAQAILGQWFGNLGLQTEPEPESVAISSKV